MDNKLHEIKQILLGHFAREDQVIYYVKDQSSSINRLSFSWVMTNLFGLSKLEHRFACDRQKMDRLASKCYDVVSERGLLVYLNEQPEALGCYIRKWWAEPVIIVLTRDNAAATLSLSAYTHIGFLGKPICFLFLYQLEKELPYLKERLVVKKEKKVKKTKKKLERRKKKNGETTETEQKK